MMPLTQEPKLVVLIDENRQITNTATNVAQDLEIVQTRNADEFLIAIQGLPFTNQLN